MHVIKLQSAKRDKRSGSCLLYGKSILSQLPVTKLGPDLREILRQSYENLMIFVQYTLILRQIYDITTIVRTHLTL